VEILEWHALPAETVLEALESSPAGLDPSQAASRLVEYGPNQLEEPPRRPAWLLFLDQFKSPLILILCGAAAAAWFFGKGLDVWVILAVVLFNATLGFVLEHRASGAIDALKRMTSPVARVVRGGAVVTIPATEVVLGDLLMLESGDRVAADARLLQVSELAVEEAGLTGESLPASKRTVPVPGGHEVPLGDRVSMVYMQTAVTHGRGRAVVVATGMETEIGRIARAVADADPTPPIQRRLARFGAILSGVIIGITVLVSAMGLVLGRDLGEMAYVGLSLAVAAIPEGLPLVVSMLFAVGVMRMARRQALIRRLPAVESLGAATVICSDKTGTLTRNQMTVTRVHTGGEGYRVGGEGYDPHGAMEPMSGSIVDDAALLALGEAARACNDARLITEDGSWRIDGDPTEGALLVVAQKIGVDSSAERVAEIPFSSERKWMATLHRAPDGELVAFAKGAAERIMPMASHWLDPAGRLQAWDNDARERAEAHAQAMARSALRVLAIAEVRGFDADTPFDEAHLRGRLTWLGLVGMIDPPRYEAKAAVATCRAAGIRVVMITGDHKETALAIACELGITESGAHVLTGVDLERLNEAELRERCEQVRVYARVSPAHKLRIVKALQSRGHIVAMTGDGVNDAPALAAAEIGIAMGITGTEVAKGAAGMVLADDNFATIVAAVEEGRAIADNLRKVIGYLMATCVANLATIAAAIATGMSLPLTAVMLLWINLVATGVFDKALAVEPAEPGVMQRPPRPPQEPLITQGSLLRLLYWGLFMMVGTLATFNWELSHGASLTHARTEAFTVMAAFQCFNAFAYRSDTRLLFQLRPNRWLLMSILAALVLQVLAVYWPPMQSLLGTEAISLAEFAAAIGVGATLLLSSEVVKALFRWPPASTRT
jgi:Ca2+-transporting ATPase